jgi:photosystem II stability/assembly factor-like uncharacterized protein
MSLGLYVGTVGMSVWSSTDHGETWTRSFDAGLYGECRVFSLAGQPGGVLAGTDEGVYRFDAAHKRWQHLPSPLDDAQIWSLVQSPHDPAVLLAGTRPSVLFRSEDAGVTWSRLETDIAATCPAVGKTRTTQILFDAQDPSLAWAGVEIDGIYRSRDAGKTWAKHIEGLVTEDIHGLGVTYPNGQRKLFAVTNRGLHTSLDDGDSWELQQVDSEWHYMRQMVERADGQGTLFLTNGNGPPGSTGRLLRSSDYGETWSDAGLPGDVNSTPWCIAVHPAEPNLVFVATNLGQLYRSTDGGESWTKLKRELGEIRALALSPL